MCGGQDRLWKLGEPCDQEDCRCCQVTSRFRTSFFVPGWSNGRPCAMSNMLKGPLSLAGVRCRSARQGCGRVGAGGRCAAGKLACGQSTVIKSHLSSIAS